MEIAGMRRWWMAGVMAVLGLAAIGVPNRAWADPIAVFSTGVSSSGALLGVGVADPNYAITASPCGATEAVTEVPNGLYVGNTATSQWITSSCQGDVGTFDYQTTFSLSGLDPSTASLTIQWAVDDAGTILLNGNIVATLPGGYNFESLHDVDITSGFVSGTNTLVFEDYNAGGPSGLQANVSGTADPTGGTVPEPAPAILLASGLLAAFGIARRRGVRPLSDAARGLGCDLS